MGKKLLALGVVLVFASAARADIRITEWMYNGFGSEFIEFTNVGDTAVDMTGWSYDDDSQTPFTVDLSGFGVVDPGESVILTEELTAIFEFDWGISGVAIVGENETNIGRNDEINLYDASGVLVDRLTYGDEDFAGSIRTNEFSGWTVSGLGLNDVYQWQLSSVGDLQGSWTSSVGDVGSPGVHVPEPTTLALLGLGLLAVARRR